MFQIKQVNVEPLSARRCVPLQMEVVNLITNYVQLTAKEIAY